jgi:hypothetical protein
MCLAVDPGEYFIEIPSPQRKLPVMHPSFSDLRGEHRTKAVPPGAATANSGHISTPSDELSQAKS